MWVELCLKAEESRMTAQKALKRNSTIRKIDPSHEKNITILKHNHSYYFNYNDKHLAINENFRASVIVNILIE